MKKKALFILIAVLAVRIAVFAECQIGAFIPCTISGRLFSENDIRDFEKLAGTKVGLVSTYITFSTFFPALDCDRAYQAGCVPMLNWYPETGKGTNTLQDIIEGGQDSYIRGFALQVKAFGRNVLIRLGQEMNLSGFAWSGFTNGGGNTNYGDPKLFDGPERYILAFRHVWNIFDESGAKNVRWVWCPNADSVPDTGWNAATNYYPGDRYVDWVGIDGYNFGDYSPYSVWRSFDGAYSNIYNSLRKKSPVKPVMIGEFSCTSFNITNGNVTNYVDGAKAAWISDAFAKIKSRYTAIKAFFWFNVDKRGVNDYEKDWRAESGPQSLAAFRQALTDPYFFGYGSADVFSTSLPGTYQDNLEFRTGPNYFKADGSSAVNFFYRVKSSSTITIRIFNANGKAVRTVRENQVISGNDALYHASWDGKNSSGSDVKPGLYLVDIREGTSNHKMERIVLIR